MSEGGLQPRMLTLLGTGISERAIPNENEKFGGDDFLDLRIVINWDFSIR